MLRMPLVVAVLCSLAIPAIADEADGGTPGADDAAVAPDAAIAPDAAPPTLAPPPAAPAPEPRLSLGSAGGSPRDEAGGVESLPGFHWVRAKECPDNETPARENGKFLIDGKGKLGCVARTRGFVKGDLTTLGSTMLILKDSRFGVAVGSELIYTRNFVKSLLSGIYLHIQPEVDLRFGKLAFGLNVPLNFLIWPGGFADGQAVLRKEDWATPSNYARVISYLTYGNKEDKLYLNISQLYAATIGHGAILKRYFANINFADAHVGAELDAYNRYAGFQFFTRDILPITLNYRAQSNGSVASNADSTVGFRPPVLAALLFARPFGWSDNLYAKYLSVGFTYAADFDAPYRLATNTDGNWVVQPNGTLRVADARIAHVLGGDVEFKAYKSKHADLKPYVDYSALVGGGGGLTAGTLGRFSLGRNNDHALRAALALRWFNAQYLPSYFDTLYEVQKYQYLTEQRPAASMPLSKLAFVLGGDPNAWFMQFLGELSYSFQGGFAVTLAYEDGFSLTPGNPGALACAKCFSSRDTDVLRTLTLHMEYPVFSFFQFFFTISKRAFRWENFFSSSDTLVFYAQARFHLAPVLFLNFGAFRTYATDPSSGAFDNVFGANLSLELGYEFDVWKKKKKHP